MPVMTDTVNLASVAASLGKPCFPCGSDKAPVVKGGLYAATRDPLAIAHMFAVPGATMIGMPTGAASGLIAIDVDVKNGAQGDAWLRSRSHLLPPTRTHKTRSGGLHLIFLLPLDADIRNSAGRVAPGVDVRGSGGYIILPPSPGYVVADPTPPAEMPGWLIAACMKQDPPATAPQPLAPRSEPISDRYTASAVDGETKAVASAAPGTRNHQLNISAVKLGSLVGAGLLEQATAERELTAAALAAGLDPVETRKTIASGLGFGMQHPRQVPEREATPAQGPVQIGRGFNLGEAEVTAEVGGGSAEVEIVERIDPVTGEITKEAVKPHGLEVLDPRDWTFEAKPREWIVPEWVPRGVVTALYGDGGMGKSLLAQQLMSCVSIGEPWLGLPTMQGRALGFMCEDDPDELHRRQQSINQHMRLGPEVWENLRYVSRVGFDNILMAFDGKSVGQITSVFDQFERLCDAFRPDFVVCDTIADFFGGNENDRGQVRQFVQNSFGRLARRFNCGVLICGHPSVSGISSGNGTGGSTAWNNTVRSRMYLTKPGAEGEPVNPDVRLLSRKKANYAARDAEVAIIWENGAFRAMAEEEAQKDGLPSWDIIDDMFEMLMTAWKSGTPWSNAPQTKAQGRYFPAVCAHRFKGEKLTARTVERLLQDWIAEGILAIEMVDTKTKKTGLRVLRRLSR